MRLVKPNYSQRSNIVDHNSFTDAGDKGGGAVSPGNPPMADPTLGGPGTTFNPAQGQEVLPSGPPKYIQPQGKRVVGKGLTNKRLPANNV